jgi:polar amino acid transport system permease protein
MLSVIGVMELFHAANSIGAETYRFLEPYTLVGLIYLALSLPAAMFIRRFEDWVRASLGMKKLYAKD